MSEPCRDCGTRLPALRTRCTDCGSTQPPTLHALTAAPRSRAMLVVVAPWYGFVYLRRSSRARRLDAPGHALGGLGFTTPAAEAHGTIVAGTVLGVLVWLSLVLVLVSLLSQAV